MVYKMRVNDVPPYFFGRIKKDSDTRIRASLSFLFSLSKIVEKPET